MMLQFMKNIKNYLLMAALTLVLALSSGCLASQIKAAGTAFAKDPAAVHMKVTTVYGNVELSRANPMTGTVPYSMTSDGNVVVGAVGTTNGPVKILLQATPVQ
jgi:hypothetical protein